MSPPGIRIAGYCVACDRMIERGSGGACPHGHPASAVAGRVVLADDEPMPVLPRFNLAAFVLPPIWGIAHGQWAGVFFLPLWAFVENAVRSTADRAWWMQLAAWGMAALTLAFQIVFARRANGLAWARVCERVTVERFVRNQRVWTAAALLIAVVAVVWVALYQVRG